MSSDHFLFFLFSSTPGIVLCTTCTFMYNTHTHTGNRENVQQHAFIRTARRPSSGSELIALYVYVERYCMFNDVRVCTYNTLLKWTKKATSTTLLKHTDEKFSIHHCHLPWQIQNGIWTNNEADNARYSFSMPSLLKEP